MLALCSSNRLPVLFSWYSQYSRFSVESPVLCAVPYSLGYFLFSVLFPILCGIPCSLWCSLFLIQSQCSVVFFFICGVGPGTRADMEPSSVVFNSVVFLGFQVTTIRNVQILENKL